MMNKNNNSAEIEFGQGKLRIEDVVRLAEGGARARLGDLDRLQKIESGAKFLDDLWREEGIIYGVTTGYGDSCTTTVPVHLVEELPVHLTRFHGCGLGKYFDAVTGRAVLATRAASLAQGYSGVRPELIQALLAMLNNDIVPLIPEEGSVGASGDLTPLSYVAAAIMGEREVYFKGEIHNSGEALKAVGIEALRLRPKEGLAIMNGTAVMTAVACLAYQRAEYLSRLSTKITSMATVVLKGNANHFDEKLFSVKPFPGQGNVAARIRSDLKSNVVARNSNRLQDRYSLRCAPHVIGVLEDSLPWMKNFIEIELNSANDNPIIDGEGEHILHGGHFYGGHIAFVMDSMKNVVANISDLLDRQMAMLMDTKFNNGLPANLSGASPDRAMINHGFKAVQIGVSAWTAEALKNTMPASVFSRSTECHNQDKVSMGTIAARDCIRVLELSEQVAAAMLLATTQAIYLRKQDTDFDQAVITPSLEKMYASVREGFDILDEDRPLEHVLRATVANIRARKWDLYPE